VSDNDFALARFQATGDIRALRAHVSSPAFVGDDDAGWMLVDLLGRLENN